MRPPTDMRQIADIVNCYRSVVTLMGKPLSKHDATSVLHSEYCNHQRLSLGQVRAYIRWKCVNCTLIVLGHDGCHIYSFDNLVGKHLHGVGD